jgi:hypothetical protein
VGVGALRALSTSAALCADRAAVSTKSGRNVSARASAAPLLALARSGVAELHASRLGSGKPHPSPLRNHQPFLLCQGGINVERKGIDIGAEFSHDERHLVRHQTGDEMHVAAQPIELRYRNGAFAFARAFEGWREFGRAIEQSVRLK